MEILKQPHKDFLKRLWGTHGDGDLLPIPGLGDICVGRQLNGGGRELFEGKDGAEEYE